MIAREKAKLRVALVRGAILFEEGALNNEASPAIGFAYISAYLVEHGYVVDIVDGIGEGLDSVHSLEKYPGFMIQGLTEQEIVDRIPADVDAIGFSGMFSGEWPVMRDLITAVRNRFPEALLVAGGEHASALPEYSLRDCKALDAIIRGEGERSFLDLLEHYVDEGTHVGATAACYLDEADEYVGSQGLERIRQIDEIPWPHWPEGYMEKFWAAGRSVGILTDRDMPMLASRGCPYQCTFCSNPSMWTTRYVLRDVDDLIDEIEHYKKKYDITNVQFYDLTAVTKKRWIVEFCTKLIERNLGVTWTLPSGTRSEALDEDTLSLMKNAGCEYLVYAPESGSETTLEIVKKRIVLDRITDSMKTAKRFGLTIRANMILGFPHETRRDIYQTVLYGMKLTWIGVDEVPYFIFSAYPGSAIYRELIETKQIDLRDEYFFSLASLNGKYSNLLPKTYNRNMPAIELAFYRLLFMSLNYLLGYVRYPRRIERTIKNLKSGKAAATVFEHRLNDLLKRRRAIRESG